jgi:lysophospholipase L1-like esterase
MKKTVLLGASYAAGWGTPELPGLAIHNSGRGGEETSQMLARFDTDVVAVRPAAVIIWGHINDIFRAPNGDMAAAAKRAMANHETMTDRAQAAGIEPLIATEVTLNERPGFTNSLARLIGRLLGKSSYQSRVSEHVRAVNEFLRELASRRGLRLLDLERAFDDGNGRRRREFSRDDGSHINDAGYAALTAYARMTLAGSTR